MWQEATKVVVMDFLIAGLMLWLFLIQHRRHMEKTASNDMDKRFKTTASIVTAERGMATDMEFGDKLSAIIREAKAKGFSGIEVVWTDSRGKEIKRTEMDF